MIFFDLQCQTDNKRKSKGIKLIKILQHITKKLDGGEGRFIAVKQRIRNIRVKVKGLFSPISREAQALNTRIFESFLRKAIFSYFWYKI